jgi:hypothetical protein
MDFRWGEVAGLTWCGAWEPLACVQAGLQCQLPSVCSMARHGTETPFLHLGCLVLQAHTGAD